jgi:hypothetical protein
MTEAFRSFSMGAWDICNFVFLLKPLLHLLRSVCNVDRELRISANMTDNNVSPFTLLLKMITSVLAKFMSLILAPSFLNTHATTKFTLSLQHWHATQVAGADKFADHDMQVASQLFRTVLSSTGNEMKLEEQANIVWMLQEIEKEEASVVDCFDSRDLEELAKRHDLTLAEDGLRSRIRRSIFMLRAPLSTQDRSLCLSKDDDLIKDIFATSFLSSLLLSFVGAPCASDSVNCDWPGVKSRQTLEKCKTLLSERIVFWECWPMDVVHDLLNQESKIVSESIQDMLAFLSRRRNAAECSTTTNMCSKFFAPQFQELWRFLRFLVSEESVDSARVGTEYTLWRLHIRAVCANVLSDVLPLMIDKGLVEFFYRSFDTELQQPSGVVFTRFSNWSLVVPPELWAVEESGGPLHVLRVEVSHLDATMESILSLDTGIRRETTIQTLLTRSHELLGLLDIRLMLSWSGACKWYNHLIELMRLMHTHFVDEIPSSVVCGVDVTVSADNRLDVMMRQNLIASLFAFLQMMHLRLWGSDVSQSLLLQNTIHTHRTLLLSSSLSHRDGRSYMDSSSERQCPHELCMSMLSDISQELAVHQEKQIQGLTASQKASIIWVRTEEYIVGRQQPLCLSQRSMAHNSMSIMFFIFISRNSIAFPSMGTSDCRIHLLSRVSEVADWNMLDVCEGVGENSAQPRITLVHGEWRWGAGSSSRVWYLEAEFQECRLSGDASGRPISGVTGKVRSAPLIVDEWVHVCFVLEFPEMNGSHVPNVAEPSGTSAPVVPQLKSGRVTTAVSAILYVNGRAEAMASVPSRVLPLHNNIVIGCLPKFSDTQSPGFTPYISEHVKLCEVSWCPRRLSNEDIQRIARLGPIHAHAAKRMTLQSLADLCFSCLLTFIDKDSLTLMAGIRKTFDVLLAFIKRGSISVQRKSIQLLEQLITVGSTSQLMDISPQIGVAMAPETGNVGGVRVDQPSSSLKPRHATYAAGSGARFAIASRPSYLLEAAILEVLGLLRVAVRYGRLCYGKNELVELVEVWNT